MNADRDEVREISMDDVAELQNLRSQSAMTSGYGYSSEHTWVEVIVFEDDECLVIRSCKEGRLSVHEEYGDGSFSPMTNASFAYFTEKYAR